MWIYFWPVRLLLVCDLAISFRRWEGANKSDWGSSLTIPTWLVHLSKSSFFSSRLKRTTPLVQIVFSYTNTNTQIQNHKYKITYTDHPNMVGPSIKVLLLLLKVKANNSLGSNPFLTIIFHQHQNCFNSIKSPLVLFVPFLTNNIKYSNDENILFIDFHCKF